MCVYFVRMGKYGGKIFQQVQIGINEWVMKMYYYMFWYKHEYIIKMVLNDVLT